LRVGFDVQNQQELFISQTTIHGHGHPKSILSVENISAARAGALCGITPQGGYIWYYLLEKSDLVVGSLGAGKKISFNAVYAGITATALALDDTGNYLAYYSDGSIKLRHLLNQKELLVEKIQAPEKGIKLTFYEDNDKQTFLLVLPDEDINRLKQYKLNG
jgi:hypothetical protein